MVEHCETSEGSGVVKVVGQVKQCTKVLFSMSAFSCVVVAFDSLEVRSFGMRCLGGDSLWYADQKSLDEFSLFERLLKNLAFARRRAAVTLFLAVLYLDQDFLVLSVLAVLKSLSLFFIASFISLVR